MEIIAEILTLNLGNIQNFVEISGNFDKNRKFLKISKAVREFLEMIGNVFAEKNEFPKISNKCIVWTHLK